MLGWMDDEALARTHRHRPGDVLVALPPGVLGQGRDLRQHPAGPRDPARLRRRHAAGQGRPAGRRLPHRRPHLLRRPRWCTRRMTERRRTFGPVVAVGVAAGGRWPPSRAAGRGSHGDRTRRQCRRPAPPVGRGRRDAAGRGAEPRAARLLGGGAGHPRPCPPGSGRSGAARRARRCWRPSSAGYRRLPARSPTRCASRPGAGGAACHRPHRLVLGGRRGARSPRSSPPRWPSPGARPGRRWAAGTTPPVRPAARRRPAEEHSSIDLWKSHGRGPRPDRLTGRALHYTGGAPPTRRPEEQPACLHTTATPPPPGPASRWRCSGSSSAASRSCSTRSA